MKMSAPCYYVFPNYKWWEALFAEWGWVRKMSKSFWIKDITRQGSPWVKFDRSYYLSHPGLYGWTKFEDYTLVKPVRDKK
jgi:hypothetical protein